MNAEMDKIFCELISEAPGTFDTGSLSPNAVVPQLCGSSPDYMDDLDFVDFSQLLPSYVEKKPDVLLGEEYETDTAMTDDEAVSEDFIVKTEQPNAPVDFDSNSDTAVDQKLYRMFPMEALKKSRTDFGQWKKTCKNKAVRSLTPRETKRLAAIRRVILARVYAEKARVKKGQETDGMKVRLGKLQDENHALRSRVQKLEDILSDLQNKFSRQTGLQFLR